MRHETQYCFCLNLQVRTACPSLTACESMQLFDIGRPGSDLSVRSPRGAKPLKNSLAQFPNFLRVPEQRGRHDSGATRLQTVPKTLHKLCEVIQVLEILLIINLESRSVPI